MEKKGNKNVKDEIVESLDNAIRLLQGDDTIDNVCGMLDELDKAFRLWCMGDEWERREANGAETPANIFLLTKCEYFLLTKCEYFLLTKFDCYAI